jgi:hypothetical protein
MRTARDVAIITTLMALGTWFLGWWAVPLVAAAAAAFDRNRRMSVSKATLAAPIAWGALLLLQGLFGSSIAELGRDVGVSLDLPPIVPLVMTLVLPTLLALLAAGTVAALRGFRAQAQPPVPAPQALEPVAP